MTEKEVIAILDKWWSGKRVQVKKYIDDKLGVSHKTGKVFIEPTIEEVTEYVKESGRQWIEGHSPETFVGFYASKDWMIGKNKMKDWGMAVSKSPWTMKSQEIPETKKPVVYCATCAYPKSQCVCAS